MGLSLREAFESVPKRGLRCQACNALRSLGSEDAETLRELLANKGVSTRIIVEACHKIGLTSLTQAGVARHRRNECGGLS